MRSLFLATTNLGKIAELQDALSGWTILHPMKPEFGLQRPPEVVEDGTTYYENALKKAVRFYEAYRQPVLSDDSGLEVKALSGAPGVFSARYGGSQISWAERWEYLWKNLRGTPQSEWSAQFRSVLCYFDGASAPVFFEGTVQGTILPTARGGEGFGYDPIFFCPALGKSFGEVANGEKNKLSHRASATQLFVKWRESLDHPPSRR